MSTITPFALGLGGGLALWYATKDRKPSPGGIPGAPTPPITTRRNVRPRGARGSQRFTREGRTILRGGEPIVRVERVDLGDQRYALSPHHADLLTERIVRLLNAHGAR